MLSASARLLELLTLLQSRREWTGTELAERLEVTPRTVRRDMGRLRTLGYPVDSSRGVAGGYRLRAGAALPPLLLDEGEAVAIAVGLRTAASAGVAGIEENSVRALAKLEQVLPSSLRRRVMALESTTSPYPPSGPTVDPESLVGVATASRDHERLRFSYRDQAGQHSKRIVEPLRLVHTGRHWYLVAWDCNREAWRTFRVDRIRPPLTSSGRFEPREPPAKDIVKYVASSIAAARDRYQAQIVLHASRSVVRSRVPQSLGTLEPLDENRCLLRTSSDWLGGLAIYVAQIGVDFEVLEPPAFADQVRVLAERFIRAVTAAPATSSQRCT